jgi:thiol:disulfide interchange protein DsbD
MSKFAVKLLPGQAKGLAVLTLLIFLSLLPGRRLMAQDTVSSTNVQFASSPTPAPAAQVKKITDKRLTTKAIPISVKKTKKPQPLWSIFIAGLLGGFAALLMPCIFPMLPLTVSYFTKSGKGAVSRALLYGLFIILIYVILGLAVTVIFGADALNSLSTNGIFNFFFFLLLVAFAASFLGAFELTLPNAWVNKMDKSSDKSGLTGLFFMAATLSLVSFSCTGPIIGTLLVQAAITGALMGPAIGMFGFSIALAIPFALFALFPGLMKSLPKSGGWLNSVKVVLGFLELALSLKFLSNVDLTYHWHWFDREVFLVLWIVIFALMGLYLLGKLKLSHDGGLTCVSVPRLFLAIIVFSFTVYMVPGLWGAPLKSIAAFLPPQDTQDFDLYTASLTAGSFAANGQPVDLTTHKYALLFRAPLKLNAFFDYKEGMAYAQKVHKPVLIDFTGHACVNCRKMEATVWPNRSVLPLIRDRYVLIQLYVDDKTVLPDTEQYVSNFSHQQIKTIGALNSDIQASRFNSNSQPDYVLLNTNEALLLPPQGANYDAATYALYLRTGLDAFNDER